MKGVAFALQPWLLFNAAARGTATASSNVIDHSEAKVEELENLKLVQS